MGSKGRLPCRSTFHSRCVLAAGVEQNIALIIPPDEVTPGVQAADSCPLVSVDWHCLAWGNEGFNHPDKVVFKQHSVMIRGCRQGIKFFGPTCHERV